MAQDNRAEHGRGHTRGRQDLSRSNLRDQSEKFSRYELFECVLLCVAGHASREPVQMLMVVADGIQRACFGEWKASRSAFSGNQLPGQCLGEWKEDSRQEGCCWDVPDF